MIKLEDLLLAKPQADPYMGPDKPDPEREKLVEKLEEKDEKKSEERNKGMQKHREQGCLVEMLTCTAAALADNMEDEAGAISKYSELLNKLKALQCTANECGKSEIVAWCTKVMKATSEKISDELQHSQDLHKQYVELTGIKTAED